MRGPSAAVAGAAALNKHQQKTEATRRKLLSAAFRVFVRAGFEASRIEDIAAEAGHTRGAFYANFATKEDLFLALLEQQANKRVSEIRVSLSELPSRDRRMRELRRFYLARSADRQWAVLTLEFKLYALRHSKLRARLAAAHQRIRESLHYQLSSTLDDAHTFESLGDSATKVLLEVLLNGLVLEHSYDPKRISTVEMTALLGRMFDILTA